MRNQVRTVGLGPGSGPGLRLGPGPNESQARPQRGWLRAACPRCLAVVVAGWMVVRVAAGVPVSVTPVWGDLQRMARAHSVVRLEERHGRVDQDGLGWVRADTVVTVDWPDRLLIESTFYERPDDADRVWADQATGPVGRGRRERVLATRGGFTRWDLQKNAVLEMGDPAAADLYWAGIDSSMRLLGYTRPGQLGGAKPGLDVPPDLAFRKVAYTQGLSNLFPAGSRVMQIDANMVGATPAGRVAGRAVHVFDRTGRQPRGVVYGLVRDGWWSVASRVTYGPKLPEDFWSPELRAADWPDPPTWGEVGAGLRTADALRLSERVYERSERPLGAGGAWSLVWRCEWTAHGPDALRRDAVPVPDTRPNPKRQMVFGTRANGLVQADDAKPGLIYRGRGVLDQLQELIAEPLGRVGLGFPESSAPGESGAAGKAAVRGWRAIGPPADTALLPVADVHPVEPTLRGFVHAAVRDDAAAYRLSGAEAEVYWFAREANQLVSVSRRDGQSLRRFTELRCTPDPVLPDSMFKVQRVCGDWRW